MFSDRVSPEFLAESLLPASAYRPFPTASERLAWQALPAMVRDHAIAQAEPYLDYVWPFLPAVRYMDFTRDGNRTRFQDPYFDRRTTLGSLVMAECLEGQGRFLDDIINGVWAICEETSWVLPAHNDARRGQGAMPLPDPDIAIVDLFCAETGAQLAWVHYLLREQFDTRCALLSRRIRAEVTARLIVPFLNCDYWWMGLTGNRVNNWNPWCTSNCLAASMLLETDPNRRLGVVTKALRVLDRFVAAYHADGGCDEGPSYWARAGGSLFEALEILYGCSTGKLDFFHEPLVAEIGRFMYRVHIKDNYFVNFADAAAIVSPPAELLYRYGCRINDDRLRGLGAEFARHRGTPPATASSAIGRSLAAAFDYAKLTTEPSQYEPLRDVWLPGTQIMSARQLSTTAGFYLAVKGGHNAESHNHNDVGNFVAYLDGRPILVDAGVETYTKQTFSAQRYDIWTMQSAYHNLPTVNGVQQAPGQQFAAANAQYSCDAAGAEVALDIAGAYPESAGITAWRRTCRLRRAPAAGIAICDAFTLRQPSSDIVMHLLTPCAVVAPAPGTLVLQDPVAGEVRLTYAAELSVVVERIELADANLQAVWGDHLNRINLRPQAPLEAANWQLHLEALQP